MNESEPTWISQVFFEYRPYNIPVLWHKQKSRKEKKLINENSRIIFLSFELMSEFWFSSIFFAPYNGLIGPSSFLEWKSSFPTPLIFSNIIEYWIWVRRTHHINSKHELKRGEGDRPGRWNGELRLNYLS